MVTQVAPVFAQRFVLQPGLSPRVGVWFGRCPEVLSSSEDGSKVFVKLKPFRCVGGVVVFCMKSS